MTNEPEAIDIEAYFRRIGYNGSRSPTFETLSALHLLHPLAIAFENLDPFLQRPVRLDSESLQQKLVLSRRGGYCFEHNLLFMAALRGLGFRVTGLAARVLWRQVEGAITPRSHMLLGVELADGTYFADVGFGGLTLTAPLRLDAGREQPTPHETFRVDRDGAAWCTRALVGSEWRTLYRFDLEEQFLVDYEVTSYFLSTNPASHFIHSLIAARPTRDGRYALMNKRLNFHGKSAQGSTRELASAGEIEGVLQDVFGVDVPDGAGLARGLQREAII